MSISIFIQVIAPPGSGPFDIYSDADGYVNVYATLSLAAITTGTGVSVPDGTTHVKVQPLGVCIDPIYINVACAPSTSTTTSSTSTTTSTSTTSSTSTTTSTSTSSTTTSTSTTSSTTSTTSSTTTTTIDPCYVLLQNNQNVYHYDIITNTSTQLTVQFPIVAKDIAHTSTKMWMTPASPTLRYFREWNITLHPWTSTFFVDRAWPVGFTSSAGLQAISNTKLIAVNENNLALGKVVEITLPAFTITNQFDLEPNDIVCGDFMLTTNNKFIVSIYNGTDAYIRQYDYISHVLDYSINITGISDKPFGVFESGGNIYIGDNNSNIYYIQNWPPFTVNPVPVQTVSYEIDGASQLFECTNTVFGTTTTSTTTTSTSTTSTTTSSTTTSTSSTTTTTLAPTTTTSTSTSTSTSTTSTSTTSSSTSTTSTSTTTTKAIYTTTTSTSTTSPTS